MSSALSLNNILFLDIETVPLTFRYSELDPTTQKLWDEKFRFNTQETPEQLYKKAGIFAEFAKIICISVGFIHEEKFRLKSFYGHDEKQLLLDFSTMLNKAYHKKDSQLCAHNGKEFDFPFIARRLLINGLPLPSILNIAGKKPWEVAHLDTLELWRFGDYKNYTSLQLLAHIFGIPTPKDDIQGSDVGRVYWEEKNLERIVTYCQKDVLTVAQLLLRFKGLPLLQPEQLIYL